MTIAPGTRLGPYDILDGDRAIQTRVAGLIDLTEPAGTERRAKRDGTTLSAEPTIGVPLGTRNHARLSPDQARAVLAVYTPMRLEFWSADWKRDAWTLCQECRSAIDVITWAPDGRRLLVGRNEQLVTHAPDGSATDEVLVEEHGRVLVPGNWLFDGRIVYQSSPDLNLLASYEIKLLEPGSRTGRVLVPLARGRQGARGFSG